MRWPDDGADTGRGSTAVYEAIQQIKPALWKLYLSQLCQSIVTTETQRAYSKAVEMRSRR